MRCPPGHGTWWRSRRSPRVSSGRHIPGKTPRTAEGVIAIDEVDLHQDPATQAGLTAALGRALPGAQWILTASSNLVAASVEARDVIALRRSIDDDRVELYVGDEARTH